MLTTIAKIFGNARGIGGTLHSQERRNIRRSGNHHGACTPFGTEDILNKIFYFAPSFTNQTHDNDISAGVTGHHPQQHTFTNAGPGKQPHTLPAPDGKQGIDWAHAGVQHMFNRCTLQWVKWRGNQRTGFRRIGEGRPSSGLPLPSRTRPNNAGPSGNCLPLCSPSAEMFLA